MPTQTARQDPYKNFRFIVRWDGNAVAAVSKVSGLKRSTQVITYREGGDPRAPHKTPGQTSFDPIVLERGITMDIVFEQWANKLWYYPNTQQLGQDLSLKDFRKDISIEMYNEAGQKVKAWNVYNCWPSSFEAVPELDGTGNAIAIESITLEHEGWDRDTSVTAPDEPGYNLPAS